MDEIAILELLQEWQDKNGGVFNAALLAAFSANAWSSNEIKRALHKLEGRILVRTLDGTMNHSLQEVWRFATPDEIVKWKKNS